MQKFGHFIKNRYQILFEDGYRRSQSLIFQNKFTDHFEDCTFKPDMELTKSYNVTQLKKRSKSRNVSEEKSQKHPNIKFKPNLSLTRRKLKLIETKRNIDKMSIGDYLHSQRKEKDDRTQRRIDLKNQKIQEDLNSKYATSTSNEIFESMKAKCLKKIFVILDSDKKGKVDFQECSLSNIPHDMQITLEPLFKELKKENKPLNCNEFIIASNNIFKLKKGLTVTERHILLNYTRLLEEKKESIKTFQFTV